MYAVYADWTAICSCSEIFRGFLLICSPHCSAKIVGSRAICIMAQVKGQDMNLGAGAGAPRAPSVAMPRYC